MASKKVYLSILTKLGVTAADDSSLTRLRARITKLLVKKGMPSGLSEEQEHVVEELLDNAEAVEEPKAAEKDEKDKGKNEEPEKDKNEVAEKDKKGKGKDEEPKPAVKKKGSGGLKAFRDAVPKKQSITREDLIAIVVKESGVNAYSVANYISLAKKAADDTFDFTLTETTNKEGVKILRRVQ